MSIPDDDLVSSQRVRVMQIILSALVGGCLIFMMIAVITRQGGGRNAAWQDPIMTYIALAFAVIVLVSSFVLSQLMASQGRRRIIEFTKNLPEAGSASDETNALFALYQTRMMVTAAPREGGAFFLLIAFLIEGSLWSLLGAGVMVAVLVSMF